MQKCQQQHRQHEQSLHVAAAVASLRVRERERENEVERDFKGVAKESGGIGGWLCELVKLSHNDVYDKFYKSSSKLSCLLLARLVFSCLARFLFLFFHFIYQFPKLQGRRGEWQGGRLKRGLESDVVVATFKIFLQFICKAYCHTHSHTHKNTCNLCHTQPQTNTQPTHTHSHTQGPAPYMLMHLTAFTYAK